MQASNDPNGVWNDYNADDVNLQAVTEKDGHLSGTVKILRYRDPNQVLTVDCPVPTEFTKDQLNRITVEYEGFNKAAFLAALLKTDGVKKKGSVEITNMESRTAQYLEESAPVHLFYGFEDDTLTLSNQANGGAKAKEMDRARNLSLALLNELGYVPYTEGMNIARLFDPAVYGYHPKTSDWQERQKDITRAFERMAKQYGYEDFNYTKVSMSTMLRGLPVDPDFSWPNGDSKEPDARTGCSTCVNLLVRDDGTIAFADIQNLPREITAAPLPTAAASWQDALKEWMATYYADTTTTKDVDYDGSEAGNTRGRFTEYSTYCVLTEIKPVYMSSERNIYSPAWCFVVEERLKKDNTPVYVSTYTLDAVTLKGPSLPAYP
jgi:hypothetical protein